MSLPKNENTTDLIGAYALVESLDVIKFTADADYAQNDYITASGIGGIVAEDVASTVTGSLVVKPFMAVQAKQAGITFSFGEKVYLAEKNRFTDVSASGILVGVCVEPSASDVFTFSQYGIAKQ